MMPYTYRVNYLDPRSRNSQLGIKRIIGGKMCINNGKNQKYINKNEEISDGWFKGGLKRKNKNGV